MVIRKDFDESPPRVEYSISTLGVTLSPILHAMEDWGAFLENKQKKTKRTLRNSVQLG